ncbi:MAG: carboxypeptidase regulatory-like domain-containing protein [Bacteroidota bacterium]
MMIHNKTTTFYTFLVTIFLLGFLSNSLNAQTTLKGKITDAESGEELIGANIQIYQKGAFIIGDATDIDGNYAFNLKEGKYDVEVSYTGYPTQKVEDVEVLSGKSNEVNVKMEIGNGEITADEIICCFCHYWIKPLIDMYNPTRQTIITSEQIRQQPTRNINEISAITPGVSFTQ